MTTPNDNEARALLIKKLLDKAEAKGTTQEERDAFSAKAAELMIKWEIDDAMISDADRVEVEEIIKQYVESRAPKSYSHEVCAIGVRVAQALGCRAAFAGARTGTRLLVVGFKSDVDRVVILYESLSVQCSAALAADYAAWVRSTPWAPSGTEKYNWKRSFIRGYADRIGSRLDALRKTVVAQSEPGTDLVLVDRSAKVEAHVAELGWGVSRGRKYGASGYDAGDRAGTRANLGGTGVGGGHSQIGR